MSANPAAVGNTLFFALGLGRTDRFATPAGSLTGYQTALPSDAKMDSPEEASAQINASGFVVKGVPAGKDGVLAFKHPFTARHSLEVLFHLMGKCTKSTLDTGIYQYVFVSLPPATHYAGELWGVVAMPPAEARLWAGGMLSELKLAISDNKEILMDCKGRLGRATAVSPATAKVGNTGTYTLGPWVFGLPADPTAGKLWFYVVDDSPVLQFKCLQSVTEPAGGDWTAATRVFDVATDPVDLKAVLQAVQSSATGLDYGVHAENKDPLLVIWPGAQAQHADLAPGDIFSCDIEGDWDAPSAALIEDADRFTSAHWISRFREVGASDWLPTNVRDGEFTLGYAIEEDRGNGSRYPFGMLRVGPFKPMLAVTRAFINRWFANRQERHLRIESEHVFEGRQLSEDYREQVKFEFPALAIQKDDRPPAKVGTIEEKLTLLGETNDDGDDPLTVTVVTDRNWTVPS